MRFTEETLERAVIELFESEQYIHCNGETIARPKNEVLIREDLRSFLLNRYATYDITENEINGIIRRIELLPASALYQSNKEFINMIANGFVLKREDRSKKDLFIELIDYRTKGKVIEIEEAEAYKAAAESIGSYKAKGNIYKIVNQLEIHGRLQWELQQHTTCAYLYSEA